MSQDTLFPRPPSPQAAPSNENDTQSTWTNWPEAPLGLDAKHDSGADRPHTISAAYERLHSRPAITAQTFEPPKIMDSEAPPLPYRPPGAFGRPILQHDDSKTPTEEDQENCLQVCNLPTVSYKSTYTRFTLLQQVSNTDSLSEAIKQLENCTAQLQASGKFILFVNSTQFFFVINLSLTLTFQSHYRSYRQTIVAKKYQNLRLLYVGHLLLLWLMWLLYLLLPHHFKVQMIFHCLHVMTFLLRLLNY